MEEIPVMLGCAHGLAGRYSATQGRFDMLSNKKPVILRVTQRCPGYRVNRRKSPGGHIRQTVRVKVVVASVDSSGQCFPLWI